MLEEIKKRLQITGNYMDDMLEAWIDSAKDYLVDGGADRQAVESAYGVIAKGVFDMWTASEFSKIFLNMATQFILAHPKSGDVCDFDTATEEEIDDIFDEPVEEPDCEGAIATEDDIDDLFDDNEEDADNV